MQPPGAKVKKEEEEEEKRKAKKLAIVVVQTTAVSGVVGDDHVMMHVVKGWDGARRDAVAHHRHVGHPVPTAVGGSEQARE